MSIARATSELNPQPWDLFIDETGNFGDPDDKVAVAALLLPGGPRSAKLFRQAKLRFEEILPEVPWPPHATALKQPLAWCAWAVQLPATELAAAARAVDDQLTAVWPEAWPEARRTLGKGRLPAAAFGVSLGEFSNLARKGLPTQWATLEQRSRYARELLAKTFAEAMAQQVERGAAAYCVLAGEALSPGKPNSSSSDRYLDLLSSAVARAADAAVCASDMDVQLRLHVLGRHVEDSVRSPKALNLDDLATLCRRLDPADVLQGTSHGVPSGGKRAQLLPVKVYRFDSAIPEPLAFADWLANCTYRLAMPNSPQPLAKLRSDLSQRTTQAWSVGLGELPTICAGDPAQAWLQTCRAGNSAGPLQTPARWATEQALLWQARVTP